MLHGMDPAPVTRCRVLELGCGVGGNLIPLAYQYPDSEFIGIDLSERTIRKGAAAVAELGLKNIDLRHGDIMEITAEFGQFDYIIAHGVYSWVPAFVRSRILAICKQNLTPQGVAYLSYNSSPGSHLRNLAREMMLYHVGGTVDPRERVQQGRAVLKFLAEASSENDVHGLVLRDQLARVNQMRDEVLYHDDLNAGSTSFWLYQVVEDAVGHGLQYLTEANFPRSYLGNHPQPVVDVISDIPASDAAVRDQYLDFIDGHGFRRTLLCHADISLQREIDPQRVKNCHVAASLAPVQSDPAPGANGTKTFKAENGDEISTQHHLSGAAFLHLAESWPQAVDFPALLESALSRLGHEAAQARERRDDEERALATALFGAFAAGALELHLHPAVLTTAISVRPHASLVARKQAEADCLVTNLRHRGVLLQDPIERQLLVLLDGTRTIDELVTDLAAVQAKQACSHDAKPTSEHAGVTRESVLANLKRLAGLALLVA